MEKGIVVEVTENELSERLNERTAPRREKRVEARLAVEVPMASWDQLRRVYTANISKGGLMFSLSPETAGALPSELELVVSLPDGRRVNFTAQVRHVAKDEHGDFDIGVQFSLEDGASRATLERALATLKN